MMTPNFSIYRRNFGHWDVAVPGNGRMFRLRGGPGEWRVLDERTGKDRGPTLRFKEQSAAMAYICAELMHELLTVEGQTPHIMEAWNVDAVTL